MDQPGAVVQRQPARQLPVVLDEALDVVVDVTAFDVARELVVRGKDPERRIGEAEAGIQRIQRVVAEVQRSGPPLTLLRLEAVRPVETGLQVVTADEPRQADGDVVGRVDVQIAGIRKVRRCESDSTAPREARRHAQARAVPDGGLDLFQRLERVVALVHHTRVREEVGQPAETGLVHFRLLAHRQAALAKGRSRASLREHAAGQLVLRAAVGSLDEGACVEVVVDGGGDQGDERMVLPRIVEARKGSEYGFVLLAPPGHLERAPQLRHGLIVQPDGRLLRDE